VILIFVMMLLLLTPVSAPCEPPVQAPAGLLTLEQALDMALRNNRNLANQAMETDKSINQLKQQKTYYLPQFKVDVLGSYYLTENKFEFNEGMFGEIPTPSGPIPIPPQDITTEPSKSREYVNIMTHVVQPLSQIYKISLGVKQARLATEVNRMQMKQQQQGVVNSVKHAYYSILQTQASLKTAEEEIAFNRQLSLLVERELQQKTALKSDLLNVQSQLANAEYQKLKLVHELASQKEKLNNLMGRDIQTPFHVTLPHFSKPQSRDTAETQATALRRNPEIQEAELSILQAKQDIKLSRAEYIPDLSLAFHFISSVNYPFIPSEMASLGLLFQWDVFEWGRKSKEVQLKKVALAQANNKLNESRASVMMGVNDAIRGLLEAEALVRVNRLAEKAARETVRITMNKYKEKEVLLKDVLQAQTDLAQATQQSQQALLGVWTARADLEKAVGETGNAN